MQMVVKRKRPGKTAWCLRKGEKRQERGSAIKGPTGIVQLVQPEVPERRTSGSVECPEKYQRGLAKKNLGVEKSLQANRAFPFKHLRPVCSRGKIVRKSIATV